MAIISSIIAEDQAQKDGRRSIREIHTDHLGKQHSVSYMAKAESDVNAVMIARLSQINAQLIEIEEQKYLSKFEDELSNPLNYSFDFTTKKAFLKRLIRYIMKHKDVKTVLAIKPLIDWLKANYTATQIATYLGVTVAILLRINNRLDAIFAVSDTLIADDTMVEDIDNG